MQVMSALSPRPRGMAWLAPPSARAALVLAGAVALTFALRVPAAVVDDSPGYLEPARSWAAGDGLREGAGPLSSRLPLYPLALGILIRLVGDSPRAITLLNAACHAAAVLLVRSVVKRHAAPALADATAAVALVWPPLLTSTAVVLQESLLSSAVALAFFTLDRALDGGRVRWAVATGAAFGLATLGKVTAFPLVLPAAALAALGRARRAGTGLEADERGRPLLAAASVLAAAVLVVLPWGIRNARVLGRFEVTNANGGQAFLGGTVSNRIADWQHFPEYLEARRAWEAHGRARYPVLDRYLYVVGIRRIQAAPGRWLRLVLERAARFILPARHWLVVVGLARTGTFPPWYVAETAVHVALFAAAACLAWRAAREGRVALLAGPLLVFGHLLVYAVVYVSPRYGVTVGPVLFGTAALAAASRRDASRVA